MPENKYKIFHCRALFYTQKQPGSIFGILCFKNTNGMKT